MKEGLKEYIDLRNKEIAQHSANSTTNTQSTISNGNSAIQQESQPSKLKAIFVGIRRTDPYGSDLKHFQRTDHGWPDFMRIHPVIDWHYCDVWNFLRVLGIPYCILYEMGYTSLGGTNNTIPNPDLITDNSKKAATIVSSDGQKQKFYPAYKLKDELRERRGRNVPV